MSLAEAYRHRHLRRIWNEVVADNPREEEDVQRKRTLEIFNNTYKDNADGDDLDAAFEHAGDAFR